MSKRYGRNQKRAHRERIAELEAQLETRQGELDAARGAVWHARRALGTARSDALMEYAKEHGLVEHAIRQIGHELGRALGAELKPHAERVLAADRDRKPISLALYADVAMDGNHEVSVIRGEIPAIHYNVMVL